jgi:hypothetical protein
VFFAYAKALRTLNKKEFIYKQGLFPHLENFSAFGIHQVVSYNRLKQEKIFFTCIVNTTTDVSESDPV